MPNQVIEGNLLEIEQGYLLHQVNMAGVMGQGIAAQIAAKWPEVYHLYRRNNHTLGTAQIIWVAEGLYVCNLYGQIDIRGVGAEEKKTNYGALALALFEVKNHAWSDELPIYIPFGMSCGLAGGDWHVVSALIEDILPQAVIVKLPPGYSRITGKKE